MGDNIDKTVAALGRHGFKALRAADKAEALRIALAEIGPAASVGVPGSATVRAVGLVEALKDRGNVVYDHWSETFGTPEEVAVRRAQLTADVLLTSANALSDTGEIVNMDGVGNRVAPTMWGPAKVVIVAGRNKIAPGLEGARERIRKVAAPVRSREMGLKNPCVEKGECADCNSKTRICRAEVILHRAPMMTAVTVIVVDEDLGN